MNPASPSLRGGSWLLVVVVAAVVLFAAYGQVLTRGPFGINDDYQYLDRTQAGIFDPGHNEIMGMGRPINAWGDQFAYGLCAGKVARLVWLRAASTVGIGVFAALLFRVLMGLRCGWGLATTVACLTALTPACGVYAGYASGVFVPLALCAALGGGWLLTIGPVRLWRDLAAGGLIVLACATWQASAPLAMFPVLAAAWSRLGVDRGFASNSDAPPPWRPWLVAGLAVVCYGGLCLLIARAGTVSAGGLARLSVATDPAAKARLLAAILRSGVTSWARLQVGPWEWAIGIVTTVGCLFAVPAQSGGRWSVLRTAGRLVLAVFLVLLSVAPLLAAREDNGAFRSLICLYVAVIFLGVTGWNRLLGGLAGWVRGLCAIVVVAASVGAARYHVWHGLVEPNLREYVGVHDEVRRQFPDGVPSHLVYLVPPYTPLAAGRLTTSWEYGLTSSTFWWVTRPFLRLVCADALPGRPVPADLRVSFREAGNPGVPVLHSLPGILREAGEWCDDARWGRVLAFRDGWLYSPWFGYLNVRWFPYIEHHLLGGLFFTSQAKDGSALWFSHEGFGQFYTEAAAYPRLLQGSTNRWLTVADENPQQLYLLDEATQQHVSYAP